jgi:hypothetical protein
MKWRISAVIIAIAVVGVALGVIAEWIAVRARVATYRQRELDYRQKLATVKQLRILSEKTVLANEEIIKSCIHDMCMYDQQKQPGEPVVISKDEHELNLRMKEQNEREIVDLRKEITETMNMERYYGLLISRYRAAQKFPWRTIPPDPPVPR